VRLTGTDQLIAIDRKVEKMKWWLIIVALLFTGCIASSVQYSTPFDVIHVVKNKEPIPTYKDGSDPAPVKTQGVSEDWYYEEQMREEQEKEYYEEQMRKEQQKEYYEEQMREEQEKEYYEEQMREEQQKEYYEEQMRKEQMREEQEKEYYKEQMRKEQMMRQSPSPSVFLGLLMLIAVWMYSRKTTE